MAKDLNALTQNKLNFQLIQSCVYDMLGDLTGQDGKKLRIKEMKKIAGGSFQPLGLSLLSDDKKTFETSNILSRI